MKASLIKGTIKLTDENEPEDDEAPR